MEGHGPDFSAGFTNAFSCFGASDVNGYNRVGKGPVRGVTLYNPEQMRGGVISWLEIADLFRPRNQASLF